MLDPPFYLVRSRKLPGITVGLCMVDVLFPVAKGQGELVIDRQSGKSSIWLCSQISQLSQNAFLINRRKIASVGSMIGGRLSTTIRLSRTVSRCGARAELAFLVVGYEFDGRKFVGNLTATVVAEMLRNRGQHWQADPSDVFYLHARLLERSCNLGKDGLAGSLMSGDRNFKQRFVGYK